MNKKTNSRYFEYTTVNGAMNYIVVFLLTDSRHMTYRSMTKGDAVICINEHPFDDQGNYILEGGLYGSWKDNEIKLLDLIDSLGLVTTDFFDYLNQDIGAWLLANLKDDSLYKDLFPSIGDDEKELSDLLEPLGLVISDFSEYLNSNLGKELLLSLKKDDGKYQELFPTSKEEEEQQKNKGKENE